MKREVTRRQENRQSIRKCRRNLEKGTISGSIGQRNSQDSDVEKEMGLVPELQNT
jgi:hypothetical protein